MHNCAQSRTIPSQKRPDYGRTQPRGSVSTPAANPPKRFRLSKKRERLGLAKKAHPCTKRPNTRRRTTNPIQYGFRLKELKLCLAGLIIAAMAAWADPPRTITIDYPAGGAVFPPDFAPPTFLWRDPDPAATRWVIEVGRLRVKSDGPRQQVGEIDERCVGAVPPELTPEQAAAHTWKPDAKTWAAIQGGSVTLTIDGFATRFRAAASPSKPRAIRWARPSSTATCP
jgi:hypothetical protein